MFSTRMLASVTDTAEATAAMRCGADVIDLKDPSGGALGALSPRALRRVVGTVGGKVPVSATTGDLPAEPARVLAAVTQVAASGVDFVKVGLFGGPGDASARAETARALGALAREGARLVAVLIADRAYELSLLPILARAGFEGVMLDTAGKPSGAHDRDCGLRAALPLEDIAGFVRAAHRARLFAGLAGSLGPHDIAPLLALRPDLLGFRGALCQGSRTGRLSPARTARVRAAIPRSSGRWPGARGERAPSAA